jgi:hypothetical protein
MNSTPVDSNMQRGLSSYRPSCRTSVSDLPVASVGALVLMQAAQLSLLFPSREHQDWPGSVERLFLAHASYPEVTGCRRPQQTDLSALLVQISSFSLPSCLRQPNPDARTSVVVDEKNSRAFECGLDAGERRNITGCAAASFFNAVNCSNPNARRPG